MADDAVRVLAVHGQLTGRRSMLRIERLVLPDGTETVRDTLYHPDSVAILPLDENGEVVLVRQYRNAAGRELLELPAGVIEGDEPPVDAARRELREETGLDATELVALGNFFASPGSMTERLHSFLARGLFSNPLAPDDDERITLERVPFDEAVRLARAGELNDAKTLASLMLAEPYVRGG
ncbi:MAG: NUDIX hydrolase [Chloroflexi bacterium]|nr:NUDIX hydrolase [Chloroflexota bacterium]